MSEDADRRAELIAGALAGELTPAEQEELDEAARRDPSIQEELTELRGTLGRLDGVGLSWVEADPPDDLADRVAAATGSGVPGSPRPSPSPKVSPSPPPGRGRSPWLLAAAAACLVGVGVAGTLTYQGVVDAPVQGPPGTLGAVEEISFTGEPTGSRIEASLVAHTWGTETLLEIDGFEVGETFEVVLVSTSGEEFSSGTFIGAEATVLCRMNAAIMREEVVQVRIDSTDETVRLVSDLPVAST